MVRSAADLFLAQFSANPDKLRGIRCLSLVDRPTTELAKASTMAVLTLSLKGF
jgi:hypothetical protein